MSPIWGGGEQWTYQCAVEFKNRGYAIEVIAAGGSKLIQKCRQNGLITHPLSSGRIMSAAHKDILHSIIFANHSVAIITNSSRDLAVANYIKKNKNQTTLIFRRGLDRPLSNNIINRIKYKQVDRIIVNSSATRRTIHRSFPWFPRENIHLVYNSIDSTAFRIFHPKNVRQLLHIPADAKVLGMIGRLTTQKGHRYGLDILQQLLKINPDTYLLIVGSGENEPLIKSRISKLNLSNHCRLVGHVDEIQPYYQACDVILIPSLFEGFCFTAIEAQLLERVVVAFNTSSLPEVVQHNYTGYLTPLHDCQSMTRKVRFLLDNSDLRMQMGRQGRIFVENRFSPKVIYDQLDSIFNLPDN